MLQCPRGPDVPGTQYDPDDPTTGDPHYKEDSANPGNPLFPCFLDTTVVNGETFIGINTPERTAEIVKAMCAAAVGSAAMLIQ